MGKFYIDGDFLVPGGNRQIGQALVIAPGKIGARPPEDLTVLLLYRAGAVNICVDHRIPVPVQQADRLGKEDFLFQFFAVSGVSLPNS